MSKLHIVPTPIGNLKDITVRALEILKNSDLIICENVLHSKVLLDTYQISTKLTSYNDSSDRKTREKLINKISQSENAVLISDAGTPLISDPGYKLVKECILNEIEIDVLPGACAAITALVASGFSTIHFLFLGFLGASQKKRRELLEKIKILENTTAIIYESSQKIIKLLDEIREILGEETQISVSKELTKVHQNTYRSSAKEILLKISKDENFTKGEFVVCINLQRIKVDESVLIEKYQILKSTSTKNLASFIARNEKITNKDAYNIALSICKT